MTNEMVRNPDNQVPDHLRDLTKVRIGNIDQSDLVIPRVKLIQAISPELESNPTAKAGSFWHTIAAVNMGEELMAIPIVIRKTYVFWAPRNDDRGILARANDGIHWDQPGAEFTVKPKGSPNPVTYKLGNTVAESGLDQFGTSIPGDSRSKPAASLTYNMLWYFPEFPELSPSVIINTRSSIRPMQQLLSKIDSKPTAHFVQMYLIGVVQEKGQEGPFFNYTYKSSGYVDAETRRVTEELYERFKVRGWQATEETADVDENSGRERSQRQYNEETASKF